MTASTATQYPATASTVASKTKLSNKFKIAVPEAILSLNQTSLTKTLGTDFEPAEHDVVCGRGKGAYDRPGNKNFQELVTSYTPEYLAARTKVDKSVLFDTIIDHVRSLTNANGRTAQFVKRDNGRWTEIGDHQARQKVGHAMREAIKAAACEEALVTTGAFET